MRRTILIIIGAVALVCAAAGPAAAAGFEVAELSGRGIGNAYAGKSALAEDATTVFFNPAGLTYIPGYNGVFSTEMLLPRGQFFDEGSTGVAGLPLGGDNGGDPGDIAYFPNLYLSGKINEKLGIGLSLNTPFGLMTDYRDGWKGRYHALESELVTYNLNLGAGYRVLPRLSAGLGVSYQLAEAKLTNAVDYGSILAGSGALTPAQLGALGIAPMRNDGVATVDSDRDGSWGWNAGLIYDVSSRVRLGLSYRSQVFHRLEGDAKFTQPANVAATGFAAAKGVFVNTNATARITLPEQISLSGVCDVCGTGDWLLLGDVTWTRWSRFKELQVTFSSAQPDAVTTENWDDTFRVSVGSIWRPGGDWTFRLGAAFDESPIPDKNRTPRIPTNDRIWATVGVGYQVNPNVAVDLSYMHVFIKDGDIDQTTSLGHRLKGEFHARASVLGLQITVGF